MEKKLIVIATPIGNISEISNRAIEKLNENRYFFCEDTRVSKKLFNSLEISILNKTFYTLNDINENNFVDNFDFKENCYVLLSDAGYPMLSDPGYYLINHFIKNNWNIEVVNGPSSIMHALVTSGFPTKNFMFYGFLNHNENIRKKELIELRKEKKTIMIFESVHRIKNTLKILDDFFTDNNICICRELTKLNETIYRGTAKKIIDQITEKGEFVILIDNNKVDNESNNNDVILFEINNLIKKGEKDKIACKIVGYKYQKKSNELYGLWQSNKNNV